jgi:hypothetical protein
VKEKPTAAYILSLIGGILGLIGGVLFLFLIVFAVSVPAGGIPFVGALFLGFGSWSIICAALVIFAATRLNDEPWEHTKWGIIILVFSIVGVWTLLGFIGGILALIYKPESAVPPPPIVQVVTRVCPKCGRVLKEDVKFCPYCGNKLG